ncbi:MAG: hypothetical protein ACOYJC_05070 [Christensenellales bacterium]|jgi:hypothetical protein
MVEMKDIQVLRDLANKLAEIANDPINQKTKKFWHANNALKPERPMFLIDQLPWHELDVNDELKLLCNDVFCQQLETTLRRMIYKWNHMRDDFVYEPMLYVPMKIDGIGFGLSVHEDTIEYEQNNQIISHHYYDQLEQEEDLGKLQFPTITLDEEETARREGIACEAFDGILEVVMDGYSPYFDMWDKIVEWRGCDNMIMDLIGRPDFMHRIMKRLTDINLHMLDQLEEKGLLCRPQQTVHCSGAWCAELPQEDYDPNRPRAKDVWAWGMAQIFSTVSPAMHDEFEVEYAKKWYSRFGLGNYGCCEPLDDRLDVIKKIPNIRKISMSPWVKDRYRAAEEMEGKYVFLNKPQPSYLISASWDEWLVENDLRETLAACKKAGCPLEYVLKDVSTVDYKPQVLWKWTEIARQVCEG